MITGTDFGPVIQWLEGHSYKVKVVCSNHTGSTVKALGLVYILKIGAK